MFGQLGGQKKELLKELLKGMETLTYDSDLNQESTQDFTSELIK